MLFDLYTLMQIIYYSPLILLIISAISLISSIYIKNNIKLKTKIKEQIVEITISDEVTTEKIGFVKTIQKMFANSKYNHSDNVWIFIYSLAIYIFSFITNKFLLISHGRVIIEVVLLLLILISLEASIMTLFFNNFLNLIKHRTKWLIILARTVALINYIPFIFIFSIISFFICLTGKLNKSVIGFRYFFTGRFNSSIDRLAFYLSIKLIVFVLVISIFNIVDNHWESNHQNKIDNSSVDYSFEMPTSKDEFISIVNKLIDIKSKENEKSDFGKLIIVLLIYFGYKISFIITDYFSFFSIKIMSEKEYEKQKRILNYRYIINLPKSYKLIFSWLYYDKLLYLSDVRLLRKIFLYAIIIIYYIIQQNGILSGLMIVQCLEDLVVFAFFEQRTNKIGFQYFSHALEVLENYKWYKSSNINLIKELITPEYLLIEQKYASLKKEQSFFYSIKVETDNYDVHLNKIKLHQQLLKENELINQMSGSNIKAEKIIIKAKHKIDDLKKQNKDYLKTISKLEWGNDISFKALIAIRYIAYMSNVFDDEEYSIDDDIEDLLNIISSRLQLSFFISDI